MLNDLFFSYIKINFTYTNSLVCKYWHENINPYLKTRKADFFYDYLFIMISNKCYYFSINDTIFSDSYSNIIAKIIKDIKYDAILQLKLKDKIIKRYYNIVNIYNKYDYVLYKFGHIIEKSLAEEYKNIIYIIYNINIDEDNSMSIEN